MTFDYLDRGDGVVFEIIHTGSKEGVSVKGSIRGFPKGVEDWGYLSDWQRQPSRWEGAIGTATVVGPIILAFTMDWLQKTIAPRHPTLASIVRYVFVAIVLVYAGLFVAAILFAVGTVARDRWRRLPKSLSRNS
jgi:hypothetical protein